MAFVNLNYKVIVVVIIILTAVAISLWLWSGKIFHLSNPQPFADVWQGTNKNGKNHKALLLQLMKEATDVFSKEKIQMIAVFGTLIGLLRHEGIIPWDDDLDVMVNREDFPKIKKLKGELKEKGIGIHWRSSWSLVDAEPTLKLFYLSEPKIPGVNWSWPFIDIFSYVVASDHVFIEDVPDPVPKGYIFPLHTNLFEGIPMNLPHNPDALLDKKYGSNWETTCISSGYNHRKERPLKGQRKVLCASLQKKTESDVFRHVWVINLDRRPDRWEQAQEQLKPSGIRPRRWVATDGQSAEFEKFYAQLPDSKRRKGEVACYKSHHRLWKKLYEEGVPYAIIFEDDIVLPSNLTKADILEVMKESPGFEILSLGHCGGNSPFVEFNFSSPNTRVGATQCTHAYVISRQGLKNLLAPIPKFSTAVDEVIFAHCKKGLCYHTRHVKIPDSSGWGLVHQSNSPSDISKNRLHSLGL